MRIPFRKILNIALIALWLGFIFARSLQPGEASAQESRWVLELMQSVCPWPLSMHLVRKLAHFVEFAVLGLLLWPVFPQKQRLLTGWGAGTLAAALDETIQRFVPQRSGNWADVCLDAAGVLFGLLLAAGAAALLQKALSRRQ